MLNRIIRYSVQNKLVIILFTTGLIIWGIWNIIKLPIDAVPDITNNQVQVITVAPSQSAQDIERLVTFPIEQSMSTIPHIREMRSISRFGLSVVTIVFEDGEDIYWARQQVSERLIQVQADIPAGIGTPSMAPVTTGLGEIYQYIIKPKKGFENKYDATELRTIQDWYLKRQLIGTEGVADVSSFGGNLKQYEIAIDPNQLAAYKLSLQDVFDALDKNNQNTGGSYIEKGPTTQFIRSEGLISSIDDIKKIVVTNTPDGIPILIRDVAKVQIGHATRYGSMTYNADGECVGGIVLMLKGENSNAVVSRVKDKMGQIEKTLPEGVEVEVFLDRSELVQRAIGTVEKNLAEGALIVILVLILFLGNFRAGLIVASVIPLSMLFAISMMNLFGVSGNLMSLGALDFGLIIDGAVIIVEAVLHKLHSQKNGSSLRITQKKMDQEVESSAGKMMNAAVFGQIIILIVYLPILVLVGVEGKMFKPMAQTVGFAIIGAFILSLTYVPMISSLVLSKKISNKKNLSDRMMNLFGRFYSPIIKLSLRKKPWIIGTAGAMFIISIIVFTQMGGEFLPALEEGDFAVETRLLTGSSMQETIDKTLMSADILLKEFPDEVEKVVGKIGTSEIPTDPMPLEACDLMVILKPKNQWKKAHNRNDLSELMSESLKKIPGVQFGFQQPIQMRFNELMTGVRQDVAVKIYGEDLGVLTDLSKQVSSIVKTVDGATDLYVEELTGLDQIVIKIDRDQVAKYGLDIGTINEVINMAFAGERAGLVYEGEKRFDLTVRLKKESRKSIEDVKGIFVTASTGLQVPLEQLAEVDYVASPNQIQRENAKRRIIVGFNVRGRDVSSVVNELQKKVNSNIDFPDGYYPEFGGQFENLQEANKRLMISVPAALTLIFLILYFTFRSLKQALLIFTSIPLSAIGGVIALLIRGMPFSISAGVGFIALFGVAVLNGIVLISEFNRLKKQGIQNNYLVVLRGVFTRLRPVLMTAMVASMGFLPMAVATSAGAEVQKPLATVVIGGLISSTILTLVVLPCLYIYFEKMWIKRINTSAAIIGSLMLLSVGNLHSQETNFLDSIINVTEENNYLMKSSLAEIDYYRQLSKTATEMPKTNISLLYGQYNGYATNDNNISISQTIPFPSLFVAKGALGESQTMGAEYKRDLTRSQVVLQLKQTYYQILYLQQIQKLLQYEDSIFTDFARIADLKYKIGDGTLIEKTSSEARMYDTKNKLNQNEMDILGYWFTLKSYMGTNDSTVVPLNVLKPLPFTLITDSMALVNNPMLLMLKQEIETAQKEKTVSIHIILPDITIGYFNQTLTGVPLDASSNPPLASLSNRFQGFQVGLSIPLWIGPHVSLVKANKQKVLLTQYNYNYNQEILNGEFRKSIQLYLKEKSNLDYYNNSALPNADLLLSQSGISYQKGDADYINHLMNIQQVITIKMDYLNALNNYNQSLLYLEYLTGKF